MSNLAYQPNGFGARGGATQGRCRICKKTFTFQKKNHRHRQCCSDSCRVIASRQRRQNQQSWGNPIPAPPVIRAIRKHEQQTGETQSQLSVRLGWNSSAVHKLMGRPTIRLGTADRVLCAIDRLDVFYTELADWYFDTKEAVA